MSTINNISSIADSLPPTESGISRSISAMEKLDMALARELAEEKSPDSAQSPELVASLSPYHNWDCGFGSAMKLEVPPTIPGNRAKFLTVVKEELSTIGFIQNGLTTYNMAINSGKHEAFSKDFLKHQTDATHKTIGQLFQIAGNLRRVIKEVEGLPDDSSKVTDELKTAFMHAQPWIKRTREVLVSAHVFYKINYVLASDKNKHLA